MMSVKMLSVTVYELFWGLVGKFTTCVTLKSF